MNHGLNSSQSQTFFFWKGGRVLNNKVTAIYDLRPPFGLRIWILHATYSKSTVLFLPNRAHLCLKWSLFQLMPVKFKLIQTGQKRSVKVWLPRWTLRRQFRTVQCIDKGVHNSEIDLHIHRTWKETMLCTSLNATVNLPHYLSNIWSNHCTRLATSIFIHVG